MALKQCGFRAMIQANMTTQASFFSRTSKMIGSPILLLLSTMFYAPALAGDPHRLADGFEAAEIDQSRWWLGQINGEHFWIDDQKSRSGKRSVAIRMTGELRGCGASCQRNEIRTSLQSRTKFGQDQWYSFSFRISGDFPKGGNERWVSGQWKQQSDGSPFLSQRFDRGVFHIAVHDGSCRILVAKGAGILEPLGTTIDVNRAGKFAYRTDKRRYRCKTKLTVQLAPNAILPDPYLNWVDMTYRVRGHRNAEGLIEIWANGRFIARVRGPIGYDGAAGPKQYFKFGIYRDAMPGTAIVHFDNFVRSAFPPKDLQTATAK